MPKLSDTQVPSYRRHKQSGQAIVTLSGQDILLGKYGTRDSREKYGRLISEWLAAGRQLPADPQAITVAEIVAAHRKHAQTYYRNADGEQTSEVAAFDAALKPLVKLYGRAAAAEFGPLKLKAVQNSMIALGWCRSSINKHTGRIRHLFKWAVGNELAPANLYHGLLAVAGLKKGRTDAEESEPVRPVPTGDVDAVLDFVNAQIGAMIRLQLLTGMRPGEVLIMRTGDIDRSGKLWVYTPQHHKTEHHGHARTVFLGPKAQEIVQPFLKLDPGAYVFSPQQAEATRLAQRQAARKTPAGYGNEPGTNRVHRAKRQPGNRYDVSSYRRAIARACDKADTWAKGGMIIANEDRLIPRWHPHRLRHNAATELRKTYGLEAAQVVLGHKTLSVTEIYAEKNIDAARRIMAEVG